MPELPEVETVRAGLAEHVLGRVVEGVEVRSPRAVRRLPGGARQLETELTGARLSAAVRRGKFLWLLTAPTAPGSPSGSLTSLLVHLGMSGQLLLRDEATALATESHPHLRVRLHLASGPGLEEGAASVVDFIDQRTFGYLATEPLLPTADGAPGGLGAPDPFLPAGAAHIARDLLDPALDLTLLARELRSRRTAVKRALLDQGLVSGIGNIYADEALWRARVHPETTCAALSVRAARAVLVAASEVMRSALAAGGTSFDALYVNVNGESGYFERSLEAYGREGEPCSRCATLIRRIPFAGRSSYFCPRCQRRR